MIHIAVVEDEKLFAEQILNFIRKYEKENNRQIKVTAYSDGEDIVEDYKGEYDIILMDIQMRFMDGMTAAEKIRSLDDEVIIMFITNMIQYAVRGYEVDAMDYVVKPVEYFSFSQKLDKAIARIRKKKEIYITVPTENGVKKLDISRVFYIESQGHNAIFRMDCGEITARASLKELEVSMKEYGFFRCAKGFLVNMKLVDGMAGSDCMINGNKIPVSRTKKKEFMDCLIRYMNGE